ncbi:MAG: hypothetical protein K0U98_05260 [Deltaproteobacteria bacterium]|nr:hypothetical protein [Deltaproteobacteria bacterium]
MPSKMVSDRQKTALSLQAAALRHAGRAAESFGARLVPEGGDGEADVELANWLTKVGNRLALRAEQLVEADRAKLGELHRGRELRRRREALTANLARFLSELRWMVDSAFGAGSSVQALGLEGIMGRKPVVVHLKARMAVERLEQGAMEALGPHMAGVAFDSERLLVLLRATTEELGAVLAELAAADRQAEGRSVAKTTSMAAFDHEAKWTARLLEAAFSLAGEVELAARVRRTARSSSAEAAAAEDNPTEGSAIELLEPEAESNPQPEPAPQLVAV